MFIKKTFVVNFDAKYLFAVTASNLRKSYFRKYVRNFVNVIRFPKRMCSFIDLPRK